MNRRAAAVLAFLALAPVPFARAVEPAAPEPLAVQLARFVVSEESWNQVVEGTTAQVQESTRQQLEQAGGSEFAAEVQEAVAKEMKTFFTYQEVIDLQAGLFTKYYTDAELREVFAFYRTPVGQKSIRIMPELTQDLSAVLMAKMQQKMPAMMERLQPIIERASQRAAAARAEAEQAKAPAPKAKK